ncbi:hypothetical protein, partial [Lactobacillus iners]|uniref:hypothetical protein n=1 Tax=Lactobacillus iners TaxID=147802 RepID=UPI0039A72F30
ITCLSLKILKASCSLLASNLSKIAKVPINLPHKNSKIKYTFKNIVPTLSSKTAPPDMVT